VGERFHRVADPLRCPGDAFASLRAPVGGLGDTLTVAKFRKSVRSGDPEDLFARPETTAGQRLRDIGFSDRMIERFLGPLFTGIALDPDLEFSSRFLEFVFRMLSEGDAAVPAAGMGAISAQLADALPRNCVRYRTEVTEVGDHHVVADGERIDAGAVVVATDAADAARLTDGVVEDPGAVGVTTWWFAGDEPPVRRPTIVLGGPDTPINNLAVLSQAAPTYAPADRCLIAVSTPVSGVDDDEIRSGLRDWYGSMADSWELLRRDHIPRAQPRQPVGREPDPPVRLGNGLFVAGDHRQHASIEGALMSGRRAGEAVAARLCRDD